MAALNARKDLVRYAEPDFIVTVDATPNDPRYLDGSLWGLHNTGQTGGTADADIDAPEGWDTRTDANSVIVAIIDTGIRTTHEDLAANLWVNPGEIAGNGIDDDNNGYIDDVHGINAITGSGDPTDDNRHGTHVAGTIGAVGNNGKGVVGVAWNVKLLGVKFLAGDGSGANSDAVESIQYATDQGARIINNSWGGGSTSQSILDSIEYARAGGAIMVIAAGNDGRDNRVWDVYPVNHRVDNIIGVAATTRSETLASFSNFGSTYVNVGAPGLDILSCGNTADDSYISLSGTSMATPQVSGVLAALAAQFPSDTYSQLINRLYRSVDATPALAGKVQTGGRVNLQKALATTSNRPVNDDFATPYIITSTDLLLRTSNRDASVESGEPAHGSVAAANTVWYSWTPTTAAPMVFSTSGSKIDTTLAVFTGNSVGSLTLLTSNDDVAGNTTSLLRIDPVIGTTYRIALGSKGADQGLVMVTFAPAPANDNFANAITISGTSFGVDGTTINASAEVGDPAIAGHPSGASVWYNWTAPSSGTFAITTQGGTGYDSLLGVFTGNALGSLVSIAENDDLSASYTSSRVTFSAVSGTIYRILIGGKNADSGRFRLTISPPPANDNFASAFTISGSTLPLSVSGHNRGATQEPGEPDIVSVNQPGGTSVWWKWTAPESLDYVVDTEGSNYDTIIAIYTGSTVSNLVKIADNDDIRGDILQSRLTMPAVAGVTYYIRVDGWIGRSGSINLKITAPIVGWRNDDFASAIRLDGISVTGTGSNVGASVESPTEPKLAGQEAFAFYVFDSVWWVWTAPATGPVRLTPVNIQIAGAYAQVLRLTDPAQPASLTNLTNHAFTAATSNGPLNFTATRGTTYYVRIGHNNSYSQALIHFTIGYNPVLTNQPPRITGATLNAGGTIDSSQTLGISSLTATDAESNPISFRYQWQRSTNDKSWVDAAGTTTATISPPPGFYWRARIQPFDANSDGVWFTTESIAVDAAPVLTAAHGQPYSYSSGLVVPAPLSPSQVPVIINEISKGSSGVRRWVELLTQQTVDLRRYTLTTTVGLADIVFADLPVWQNVPAGTLIVIYNGPDRDPALPPNDSDMADGRLILADNNTAFFSLTHGTHFWNTNLGDGNPNFLLEGRGLKIHKTGSFSAVFGLEWGGSSGTGLYVPTFQSTFTVGQSLRYIGGAPDGAEVSSSWEFANTSAVTVSPGSSNSVMNDDFVQRLRSSAAAPRFRLVTPAPSGLSFDPATGTLSGTPNIPAGGTFTVTIERFNPYNSALRSYQLVVAPAPLPSLAVFRAANGLATNGSQDAEAPAGDGVANLLKYAFNMIGTGPGQSLTLSDPNSTILAPDGTVGLPLVSLLATPSPRLEVTYIRRKASDSPGIIYAIQFSETLASGSWYINPAANTTITSVDGNWERVFVRDSEPTPTRLFARVAVTLGSATMPVIASPSSATATINGVFSYAISASNSPTAYSATGLPPGLTLDPATGIISGTATVEGVYTVTIGVENAAGIATQILTIAVQQLSQTITFASLATKTVEDPTFNLTATASSGLTVSYTSSNLGVATILGNTVTVVGVGSSTITASQAGNASFTAAANVIRALTVNPVGQVSTIPILNFGFENSTGFNAAVVGFPTTSSWAGQGGTAASAQGILTVDFGNINGAATSNTQSGFQAFNINQSTTAARTASFTGSDASNITVNLPNGTTTSRDRGTGNGITNSGAFTYSDLYRDMAVQIARNSPAAGGTTPTLAQVQAATSLSLTGLNANRTYTIRLWSVNPGNDNNQVATWFNLTPQTFAVQGAETSLGTITNLSVSNPISNTAYSISATVTSNQNGELYFRQSMSAGSGHINGFELSIDNTEVRTGALTGKQGNNYLALTADAEVGGVVINNYLHSGSLGTFAANTTYVLTVAMAAENQDRLSFIGLATGTTTGTLAGQTSVNSQTMSSTTFADYTYVLDTSVTTGVVGQPIRIFLGQTTTPASQYLRQTYFDNVRLISVSAP